MHICFCHESQNPPGNRRVTSCILCLLIAALLTLAPQPARASVLTVDITEQGSDVDVTATGSLDLSGMTYKTSGTSQTSIGPQFGFLGVGSAPDAYAADLYQGVIGGPLDFGPGSGIFSYPTSGTGIPFEINRQQNSITVQSGYASGTAISDTNVYSNATLSSLGITPGTYTWTWNGGANSVVLNATPEPASLSLLAISGVAMLRRRRMSHLRAQPVRNASHGASGA
jgi:hypothetical protein